MNFNIKNDAFGFDSETVLSCQSYEQLKVWKVQQQQTLTILSHKITVAKETLDASSFPDEVKSAKKRLKNLCSVKTIQKVLDQQITERLLVLKSISYGQRLNYCESKMREYLPEECYEKYVEEFNKRMD